MNRFRISFLVVFLCSIAGVRAQEQPVDTITQNIKEVIIHGKQPTGVSAMNRFDVGVRAVSSDSIALATISSGSLVDFIQSYTPILIKENGNGMLATVSIRGTASSHTAVSWNGIDINSLTMGQIDFNQLPVFFFDRVDVYPGSSSALYGSGSIGGSIRLSNNPGWDRGFRLHLEQTAGSFGHYFAGAKVQAASRNIESKTSLLFNRADNRFPFENVAKYNLPLEKQGNATFRNYGVLQELNFRLPHSDILSVKVWYMDFLRQIQPQMGNNTNPKFYDEIHDNNLRTVVHYDRNAAWAKYSATVGYVYDREVFRDDLIASHSITATGEIQKNFGTLLSLKVGGNSRYIRPDVYAYHSGISEWRNDVYLLSQLTVGSRFTASVNMRQAFVTGIDVPFAPSAGMSFHILKHPVHRITLRTNAARSFKVPTLNDRYWSDDTQELQPEDAFNMEAGLDYAFISEVIRISVSGGCYRNMVDHWIIWIPYGHVWKPRNIEKVRAQGLEASLVTSVGMNQWKVTTSANYAFTNATVIEEIDENDPNIGLQLPFQPKHRTTLMLRGEWKKWFATSNAVYTGTRTTSDKYDLMDAYLVVGATAGRNFVIDRYVLSLSLQVHNLMNESYQSMPFFAMPGRYYEVSVKFDW